MPTGDYSLLFQEYLQYAPFPLPWTTSCFSSIPWVFAISRYLIYIFLSSESVWLLKFPFFFALDDWLCLSLSLFSLALFIFCPHTLFPVQSHPLHFFRNFLTFNWLRWPLRLVIKRPTFRHPDSDRVPSTERFSTAQNSFWGSQMISPVPLPAPHWHLKAIVSH